MVSSSSSRNYTHRITNRTTQGELNKDGTNENIKLDRNKKQVLTYTNIKIYVTDWYLQGSQKNNQLLEIKRVILDKKLRFESDYISI